MYSSASRVALPLETNMQVRPAWLARRKTEVDHSAVINGSL
jgi:hypothetical protein